MEKYIGIDWGHDNHHVEIQDADGKVAVSAKFGSAPEQLCELRDKLLAEVESPDQMLVGIEDPGRPIVRILLEADIPVFVITPRQVDKMREVYSQGGTKTDALDAHVICEELRVHPKIFYEVVNRPPEIGNLRHYHRALQDALSDKTRFANRFRETLRYYYPQFLELEWSVDSRVMLDLFELMPTPKAARQASIGEVDEVLGRCRKHTAEEVLERLTQQGSPIDKKQANASADIALDQAGHLRQATEAEDKWANKLKKLLGSISDKQKTGKLPSAHRQTERESDNSSEYQVSDVEIALSIKGLGIRCVAGLFAEGFQAIVTQDRQLLRKQSIAPVTKKTGKASWGGDGPDPHVVMRYAGSGHLTNTMHHIGDSLQKQNQYYRQMYADMKDNKGHTHGRACRQVTDSLLRVLFAMFRDRTTYNANLHGATLN